MFLTFSFLRRLPARLALALALASPAAFAAMPADTPACAIEAIDALNVARAELAPTPDKAYATAFSQDAHPDPRFAEELKRRLANGEAVDRAEFATSWLLTCLAKEHRRLAISRASTQACHQFAEVPFDILRHMNDGDTSELAANKVLEANWGKPEFPQMIIRFVGMELHDKPTMTRARELMVRLQGDCIEDSPRVVK